ncbi:unnamed protein product [Protopolystoma xenopodis]|uniref:Uncharacterized protein n=1 Tax=Protopolystoma xenopodis TaxID=117903 RepID=A0A448XC62_9PLAT|nr:unnamed protein product [Protopolystoma xenopodis]
MYPRNETQSISPDRAPISGHSIGRSSSQELDHEVSRLDGLFEATPRTRSQDSNSALIAVSVAEEGGDTGVLLRQPYSRQLASSPYECETSDGHRAFFAVTEATNEAVNSCLAFSSPGSAQTNRSGLGPAGCGDRPIGRPECRPTGFASATRYGGAAD